MRSTDEDGEFAARVDVFDLWLWNEMFVSFLDSLFVSLYLAYTLTDTSASQQQIPPLLEEKDSNVPPPQLP